MYWLFYFKDVGHKYLNFLIGQRRYEDAARRCVNIYGRNKDLWEAEAYRFAKIGQLKVSKNTLHIYGISVWLTIIWFSNYFFAWYCKTMFQYIICLHILCSRYPHHTVLRSVTNQSLDS